MTALPPSPERAGRAPDPVLAARRAQMNAAVAEGRFKVDPPAQKLCIEGTRALRFACEGRPTATILHFHGGGLRLGCPDMLAPYAAALAREAGVEVICPEYRLAPEHPFPAGLNDAWRVAASVGREGPLLIAGDSAGGGIAASLTSLLVAADRPPAGLVLVSPWLDLTLGAASYEGNAATDDVFSRAAATEGANAYLAGLSAGDPRASPLFAGVAGFPPTLVIIGEEEVLADDGRSYVAALDAAGIQATLMARAGTAHAAVTRSLKLPGAPETFAGIAAFVMRIVG